MRRSHRIHAELENYENLMSLQGCQIPVCLGMFSPKIPYWYHGVRMECMLLLSWSGIRTEEHATLETRQFLEQEVQKLQDKLQEHGVIQRDATFRNVLWNPMSQSFVMIDLEDLKYVNGVSGSSKGHGSRSSGYLADDDR